MKRDSSRRFPILLLVLASALCLTRLSGRDLWEPNEPISAEAAREMALRGDWLLPTVNGIPYPDKPPLLFWGIRLAALARGGIDETGARLPSALSGVALVGAIYFLSRRVLGPRAAFLSAAVLAVSSFFVEQARYVQHDMLLCFGVTVATLSLFAIGDDETPRAAWVGLAAGGLAFGILAKGPIGGALPAMILGVESLFEARLWRRWKAVAAAGLLGLLPPFLYYVALARGHGLAVLSEFLLRHNMDRYVSGFDHAHPWWFFLARSPVDLLPGSLMLPAAAAFRPSDPYRGRFHRRLWLWTLLPLIFFSFSASKRPVYMLSALPAVAMLAGSVMESLIEGTAGGSARRWGSAGLGGALGTLGIAAAAAPFLARKAPDLRTAAWFLAVWGALGSIAGLVALARGRFGPAIGSLVIALAGVWLVADFKIYPEANALNSPRPFAERISQVVPVQAPLRTYGLYRFRSGYLFYSGRLMPPLADLHALADYLAGGETVYCVVPRGSLESIRKSVRSPFYLLAEGGAGHRRDCLISNRPAPESGAAGTESPDKDPASPPPGARSETGS